jgi:hypothetical protein
MDLRQIILDELKAQSKSRYWVATEAAKLGLANRESVFRYLRAERDTSSAVVGGLLDLLGLGVAKALSPDVFRMVHPAKVRKDASPSAPPPGTRVPRSASRRGR